MSVCERDSVRLSVQCEGAHGHMYSPHSQDQCQPRFSCQVQGRPSLDTEDREDEEGPSHTGPRGQCRGKGWGCRAGSSPQNQFRALQRTGRSGKVTAAAAHCLGWPSVPLAPHPNGSPHITTQTQGSHGPASQRS